MRRCIYLAPLLVLLACGKGEETAVADYQESAVSTPIPNPAPAPAPELGRRPRNPSRPAPAPTPAPIVHGAALWSHIRGTESWSQSALETIRARISQLERARDVDEFCPDYQRASNTQREACWLRLVSAVSKFESSFNPRDTYRERTGQLSIGLLSLSRGECPEARSESALKHAENNLRCGIRIMAELIAKDGVIENSAHRGASDYWSVLRRSYGKGRKRHGHRHHIIGFTKDYQAYSPR